MRPVPTLLAFALFASAGSATGQSLQVSVTANGSSSALSSGGSLSIASSSVGQPVVATVTISNGQTTAANVTAISLAGSNDITLQSAPAVPFTISPGASASFAVQYLASSGNAATASISIAYAQNDQPSTFQFSLTGTISQLSYAVTTPLGSSAISPGGSITIPATAAGQTTSMNVSVTNNGSASAQIPSISVTGQGFSLSNLPALPLTLAAGTSAQFTLNFASNQSTAISGQLTIGSVSFSLTASSGANLGSFSITYALADGNAHVLSTGSTISFPAVDINAASAAIITITNQGSSTSAVSGIAVNGSAFQLNGAPALPAAIAASQSASFRIVFAPTQPGSYSGSFTISYSGGSVTGTLTATTAASNISLAYIDPATNNTIPLPNNSALPFPDTLVGSFTNIVVTTPNRGAGTGSISSISLGNGAAPVFQLLNLPALPLSVPPSQQALFGIRFTPAQLQSYTTALTLIVNNSPITINVTGQGSGPNFSYSAAAGSGTAPFTPAAGLAVPATDVGNSTALKITVSNNGTVAGQIPSIGVTGQGFSVSGLPPAPLTLAAGASAQFTLTFAPTQPGNVTGQLTIGNATFALTSTAVGSQLVYTYTSAAGSSSVPVGGTFVFAPIAVGGTESLSISIQNSGTSAAPLSSVGLASSNSVFTLQGLPALPRSLAPGDSISFTASFAPANTGVVAGILAINTVNFTVSGTGTPPPSLPGYQFQGPTGTLAAAQQPTIGLTLSSAYSLPVQGSLTLKFVSDVFSDDPSVQFASGGRTVNFTIPVNSTKAVFAGNNTTIAIQSGTTAGTIIIIPSFATQGGFDLTPSSPTQLNLTVPRTAPLLTAATITSVAASGFNLVVSGYSTTRTLSEFDVQFTPIQGANLSTSTLAVSVTGPASTWFQSTGSQAFGGSFVVSISFAVHGGSTSTTNPVSLLQSVTVAAKNDVGGSNSISVNIQ